MLEQKERKRQNIESYFLLLIPRLPFEWKTPFKFFVTCSMHSLGIYYNLIMAAYSLGFLVGSCISLMCFAKDLKSAIHYLMEAKLNDKMFIAKLREVVDFHAKIKQLSEILRKIILNSYDDNIVIEKYFKVNRRFYGNL